MDEVEKKLRSEESTLKVVQQEREKLIADGCYPEEV